jgi:hypothetical protein
VDRVVGFEPTTLAFLAVAIPLNGRVLEREFKVKKQVDVIVLNAHIRNFLL